MIKAWRISNIWEGYYIWITTSLLRFFVKAGIMSNDKGNKVVKKWINEQMVNNNQV